MSAPCHACSWILLTVRVSMKNMFPISPMLCTSVDKIDKTWWFAVHLSTTKQKGTGGPRGWGAGRAGGGNGNTTEQKASWLRKRILTNCKFCLLLENNIEWIRYRYELSASPRNHTIFHFVLHIYISSWLVSAFLFVADRYMNVTAISSCSTSVNYLR